MTLKRSKVINDRNGVWTSMHETKYLFIQKRSGGARNRDNGYDLPIQDCTHSPDLDDMITNGPGEVTISEGDNNEMSWEWDDYIIIRTGSRPIARS